jgi:2-polyprenyl-3-methyl-5-hydroxy-6-metoxy-1,4-benzoquinol methylase
MTTTNPDHHAELTYQAERALQMGDVHATPDYIIERYRRCRHWRLFPKELMFKRLHRIGIAGKEVLEFGCGEGTITTQLARLGGRVTGVDISPDLIACAERRAELDGVRDRVRFIVGDVLETPLPVQTFDILVCHAALHHADPRSLEPLFAALKPGGLAILVEPIAFSAALRRFRDLVPIAADASPDERQLASDEVDSITRRLYDCEVTYFNMVGRLSRLLPNRHRIDRGHPVTKAVLLALLGLDRILLAVLPFLSRVCGTIVIVGRKPSPNGSWS